MVTGVCTGRAVQSGSCSRIAAIVSETLSPRNARRAVNISYNTAAERPDVGALVDRPPTCLLWAHVGGGAGNDPFTGFLDRDRRHLDEWSGALAPKHLRQPEVEHLDGVVGGDLDVRRFQIAVDDALFMRRFERVGDLASDREGLLNRQRTLSQALGERRALDELEHEPADAVGLLQSVDRANVRMVQRRQDPRLAFEAGETVRVRRERHRRQP